MSNKKHYIITSITLGAIGAVSAGLIGVVNLITRDRIAQNEVEKINKGIVTIFGQEATNIAEKDVSNLDFSSAFSGISNDFQVTFSNSYEIKNVNETTLGYALRATGSNMYGKISLIIGVENSFKFKGLYEIVNEQTYASTLEDKYLTPLNEGTKSVDNEDDVKCGATYGAKLTREMVLKSTAALKEIYKE